MDTCHGLAASHISNERCMFERPAASRSTHLYRFLKVKGVEVGQDDLGAVAMWRSSVRRWPLRT